MDMRTYFSLPEVQNHEDYESTRKYLPQTSVLSQGEIREGMLLFNDATAARWAGPYAYGAAYFNLVDHREWSDKWCGRPVASAQADALERLDRWIARKPRQSDRLEFEAMKAEVVKGNHAVIHQLEERGTKEYPYRIWIMGNGDTSYSKWFATLEEAEELLTLMESMGPLDFEKDFLPFTWTFTN